jgi:adenosine kinase
MRNEKLKMNNKAFENTKVVVTGSLAFDNIMSMPGRFKDHILPDKIHILNVSFTMDTFRKEYGGTGGNQAYTLALLGIKPLLVAAAGNDFSAYKKHLVRIGIDLSGIVEFKDVLTATGFVTTDKDDNQIWGFYGGAMFKAKEISIEKYIDSNNSFVLITPDDPDAMGKYVGECVKNGASFLFDPAFYIPTMKLSKLKKGVNNAKILIGNDYEISLLKKRIGFSRSEMIRDGRILITTLGEKGSIIEKRGERHIIPAAKPENTSDPTGAGDAYRAGFVAGYLRGFSLPVCGRMGATAAVYTVEKYGTQTHKFSLKEFERRYSNNFQKKIKL